MKAKHYDIFMSIFKAGANARYTFDLKDFIAAMGAMHFEYGCKGTKHFFTPTSKAADAFGGKTYVLHLHSSEVNGYVQDNMANDLSKTYGFTAESFQLDA